MSIKCTTSNPTLIYNFRAKRISLLYTYMRVLEIITCEYSCLTEKEGCYAYAPMVDPENFP